MKSFKEIQKIQEYAARHPSFIEELDDPERQKIMEKMMAFSYRKGEAIFSEGEPADSLYVIRKGNVKLCTYDGEGREQIISIFSAGDTIWVSVFLRKSLSNRNIRLTSFVITQSVQRTPRFLKIDTIS